MNGHELSRRVALVTGGSGGIGAELCVRLAAAGAIVGVHYGTGSEAAEVVVARIAGAGAQAATFAADLRDPNAPARRRADPLHLVGRGFDRRHRRASLRVFEGDDLAIAILCNGYVTNQVISVDGGMHPG